MAREQRAKVTDTTSRQVGSRWIGNAPSGEDVAKWFAENVKLHHPELRHADYVQGVTLITSSETTKELRDGAIVEVERLVHVPYAKVETRIAYFWDYCRLAGLTGVIEPVQVRRVEGAGVANTNLPDGFFRIPVQEPDAKWVYYVACAMKATVYQPDVRAGGRGRAVVDAPPAVKQVALVNRYGDSDPYALMKAETGAVGRALGMAGMLALPGSGVATAEDMQEALSGERPGGGPAEPALPADSSPDGAPGPTNVADLVAGLPSEARARLTSWATSRRPPIDLDDIKPTQERAVRAAVEKLATEAPA